MWYRFFQTAQLIEGDARMGNSQFIRGPAKQCLAHYFKAEWNGDPRAALAELTGCAPGSVRQWARTGTMPQGYNLLRLVHYLGLLGYDITELRGVDRDMIDLARMITLKVIGIDDVAVALRYERGEPSDRRTEVYRILLHKGGMSSRRIVLAQDLLKAHREKLKEAEADFRLRCPKPRSNTAAQPAAPKPRMPQKVAAPVPRPSPQASTQTVGEHDLAGPEVAQIAAALSAKLYQYVRRLCKGKSEHIDAFRAQAPDIGRLAEFLLVIDAGRK